MLNERNMPPVGDRTAAKERDQAVPIGLGRPRPSAEIGEGWAEVGVLGDLVHDLALQNIRTDDDEWHVNVGVEERHLAGAQRLVGHVIVVVGSEDDVGLIGNAARL